MAKLIETCESEKLHLSGAIQPHGSLLVCDAQYRITHLAANAGRFLPVFSATSPALLHNWIGQPLPTALRLCAEQLSLYLKQRMSFIGAVEGKSGMLDVVCSRQQDESIVIELTRTPHGQEKALPQHAHLDLPPDSIEQLAAAQAELVDDIFEATGFERVLYHRFYPNGDGQVIYERKVPDLPGSYLGLRFPASDIPAIARALYMKNPWRLIPDAQAETIPVLGVSHSPIPDLTHSDLRSASPIHCAYLANMGVRASFSLPVVTGGELSALVVAHHRESREIPLAQLEQIAARLRAYTLAHMSHESRRRICLVDGLANRFESFTQALHRQGDFAAAWREYAPRLLEEFQADGVTLCRAGKVISLGNAIEPDALAVLDDWFSRRDGELVWSCDSLSRHIPEYPLSATAGVLAMKAGPPRDERIRVYLTRCEHIHDIAWGGNPDKPFEALDGKFGITPRRSFEKWIERRMGYSRPWQNESRLLALKLREMLH